MNLLNKITRKALPYVLAGAIAVGGASCGKDKSTSPSYEIGAKTQVTNSKGQANFIDNSTLEEVVLEVVDKHENPLQNMDAYFLDHTEFKWFIVEDSKQGYRSSMKIEPGNSSSVLTKPCGSSHTITMHMMGDEPIIREADILSGQGQAVNSVVEHMKSKRIEVGYRTPEELEKEDEISLKILGPFLGGLSYFFEVAGVFEDFTKLVQGFEEPDYYHVYDAIPMDGITTTFKIYTPDSNRNGISDYEESFQWVENPSNKHWYALTSPVNWKEAQLIAIFNEGYLVSISDKEEEKWLDETFNDARAHRNGDMWIGLTDKANEGTWTWVNGEPVSYLHWYSGEPNNGGRGGNEDLVTMNYKREYSRSLPSGWNDCSDKNIHPAIVERDTRPLTR